MSSESKDKVGIITEAARGIGAAIAEEFHRRDVFARWNIGRTLERDGVPQDVAQAAVFLASDESDWITGVTLDVNGGIFIH